MNDFGGATNVVTIDTATGTITNKGASVNGLDSIAWGGCAPPPQTTPGGTVPATLSLTLGSTPRNLGSFIPGIAAEYMSSVPANVISTAGDAALSVADASTNDSGQAGQRRVLAASGAAGQGDDGERSERPSSAPISGNPLVLTTWNAPVSNDTVTVSFKQAIGATDALRTGTYAKTLTFTLSTTTP